MNPLEWIRELTGAEEPCTYLEGQRARMRFRLIDGCKAETCERLLAAGWRRFGRVFFRPVCTGCQACIGLRVAVDGFAPNRSMRRAWRGSADLEVRLGRPRLDDERLTLYARYHRDQAARHGWPDRPVDPARYHETFVDGAGSFGHELSVWRRDRLLAIALIDVLPGAVSAVYTYYEPAARQRSLGVLAVLHQVALARELVLPWLYLGYWIEENASMRYKSRYRPHQLLEGRPEDDEMPRWQTPLGGDG